jgi:hypothetical protein
VKSCILAQSTVDMAPANMMLYTLLIILSQPPFVGKLPGNAVANAVMKKAYGTIELLYSYLAGMNGVAYTMHNVHVLCKSVTIEARLTDSVEAAARNNTGRLSTAVSGDWRLQKPPGIRLAFG